MRKRSKRKPERKPAVKIPDEYRGIARLLRYDRKPKGGTVVLERYAIVPMLAVDLRPA
jgi:hypothetical protein